MRVASLQRSLTGWGQELHRSVGEPPSSCRIVPELRSIVTRLLEVVRDDQVVLAGLGLGEAPKPTGKTLMELCAFALWQTGVRRVAYKEVAETVRLVIGKVRAIRADQVSTGQLSEEPWQVPQFLC